MTTNYGRRNQLKSVLTKSVGIGRQAAGLHHVEDKNAKRDGEEKLKLVPKDTRNWFERWAGDPLPGRSALDQDRERQEHERWLEERRGA